MQISPGISRLELGAFACTHEPATLAYRRALSAEICKTRSEHRMIDRGWPGALRATRGQVDGGQPRACDSLTAFVWPGCPTTAACLPSRTPLPPEGLDAGPTTSSEPEMFPRASRQLKCRIDRVTNWKLPSTAQGKWSRLPVRMGIDAIREVTGFSIRVYR